LKAFFNNAPASIDFVGQSSMVGDVRKAAEKRGIMGAIKEFFLPSEGSDDFAALGENITFQNAMGKSTTLNTISVFTNFNGQPITSIKSGSQSLGTLNGQTVLQVALTTAGSGKTGSKVKGGNVIVLKGTLEIINQTLKKAGANVRLVKVQGDDDKETFRIESVEEE